MDTIKNLYLTIGLSRCVTRKVIKAHNTVLKHGLATGTERVVVIDSKTGRIVADETGSATRVAWRVSPKYSGSLIVVHNHPMSTPFSTTDLCSFGSVKQLQVMSVQGHSGIIYTLCKSSDTQFVYTEDVLRSILMKIRKKFKDKSKIEQGEIFVRYIAERMKWGFMKGGE